jgi:hypothetical protein
MAPKSHLRKVWLGTVSFGVGVGIAAAGLCLWTFGGKVSAVSEVSQALGVKSVISSVIPSLSPKKSSTKGTRDDPQASPHSENDSPADAMSMDADDFRALTESAKKEIPTIVQIQALPEEAVHHMPAALIRAGKILGHVAQALHDNPELASVAEGFYGDCASQGNYPDSVRALCFADLKKIDAHAGESAQVQLPPSVLDLASNL